MNEPLTALRRRDPINIDHPDDVLRIEKVLAKSGYTATHSDIQWAWRSYSDERCAGWLYVDSADDQELLSAMLEYLVQP